MNMKSYCLIVFAISALIFNAKAHANTDQILLNEKLFQSVVEGNVKEFQEYLAAGADPNWMTDGETYPSSAFCEATKRGNESFLEVIVQFGDNIELLHGLGIRHSPASCAILYSNVHAFRMVVNMGIDITAVLNPDSPLAVQRTLLDNAIGADKAEIIWEIIQQTEPNEKQIVKIVRRLEFFGGFEADKSRTSRLILTQWLQDRGYEVELAPAAPDPRTYKR